MGHVGMSRKFRIPLSALLGLAFLVGCGVSTVTIEGSFPTPNISKLPLNVAVYYYLSLSFFAYMEFSDTGAEVFNVQSGQSHIALFNAVLPAMFDDVVVIDSLDDAVAAELTRSLPLLSKSSSLLYPRKPSSTSMRYGSSTICASLRLRVTTSLTGF